MCGILTFYAKTPGIAERDAEMVAARMPEALATLARRGPDETHHQKHGQAWYGHTRLSIIDLNTGSQPIFNEDGTVGTILNGEIYNFLELRASLEDKGHVFKTRSDTEVLVHLYEEYGEDLFGHLNGMFAAVVHDQKNGLLLAGRDRTGEKPLLYHQNAERVILASELKAILGWPGVGNELDRDALALYLNSMFVPAPLSIIEGIRKVPPAHFLRCQGESVRVIPYWRPHLAVDWAMTEDKAVEEFEDLFRDSVARRIIADVPLGVFLSGGIDSSAVTAFVAQASSDPVKTFSVGFESDHDERPFARLVADRYRTDHTELFVRDSVLDAFPVVMDYFDEPFADSSAIPTYLVAREARKHVKVALTGDGGDELFAGYDTYIDQMYQRDNKVSTKLGRILHRLTGRTLPYPARAGAWPRRHWRLCRSMVIPEQIDRWLGPGALRVEDFYRDNTWFDIPDQDALSVAFSADINYYLPDDLLKKVDMAAMLTSLECRAPFLDHRLVEFAMRIPPTLKLKNDSLKHVLKRGLEPHLPAEVLHRSKMGFGAPVLTWVRGPLRELAGDLTAPGCRSETHIAPDIIRSAAAKALGTGSPADYRTEFQFWNLVVLEWWLRKYL